MKKFFVNSMLICISLALLLVCAEIMLRFLPVSSGLGLQPVSANNPVFRATPNKDITYSIQWNFKLANTKHINNAGFVNPQDYTVSFDRPLLAVVGDSYVEALQVNDSATYYQLLAASKPGLRVYSFGFSGAPLSQYLIWAQHAKQAYNNDYLIINVVGNDYDESLKKYKFAPGFYHYAPNAVGMLQLERNDWLASPYRDLAKKSQLISYLVRNLEITASVQKLIARFSSQPQYVGNVAAVVDETRITDSYAAIDAFFRDLPAYSGLPAAKVAFVLDDRTLAYLGVDYLQAINDSYVNKMKTYFIQRALTLGYNLIDMAMPFQAHFKQHGQHFEFACDSHWNVLGHQVVAEAVQATGWWQGL